MRSAYGGIPYALGKTTGSGAFHIRCIRFGKLGASYERRADEEIRAAKIVVSDKACKPLSVTTTLKRLSEKRP
jgi:hypothetical protein